MPEYLAPGVYVEEVDTGSKPIEGVSTSTAGMIGVTERGPVDVPILITSYGEYVRWFGERLNILDFQNADGPHCYLPQAVEGFFTNAGKRIYIVRVLDSTLAESAAAFLFDRGAETTKNTLLLRAVGENTGTVATPPALYLLDNTVLTGTDPWFRVGDGSSADYVQLDSAAPVLDDTHVPLNFPLSRSHEAGKKAEQFTNKVDTGAGGTYTGTFSIVTPGPDHHDTTRGTATIAVQGEAADITKLLASTDQLLEIGVTGQGEYRFVRSVLPVSTTEASVILDNSLVMAYKHGATVSPLVMALPAVNVPESGVLESPAAEGDRLLYVVTPNGPFATTPDHLVVIDSDDLENREVRRIGQLFAFTLATGAYDAYAPGSAVEKVELADDDVNIITNNLVVGATTMNLDDVTGLAIGMKVTIDPTGSDHETVTLQTVKSDNANVPHGEVTFTPKLVKAHNIGIVVAPEAKALTAAAAPGATLIALNNRLGLAEGDLLSLGVSPNEEYVLIKHLPGAGGAAPDAGNILLAEPLSLTHAQSATVRRQHLPVLAALHPTVTALSVPPLATILLVTDGNGFAATDNLRITTPTGEAFFHRLTGASALTHVQQITTQKPLRRAHGAGATVVVRNQLLQVQALDPGTWGNRLRISVQDSPAGLVSKTTLVSITNPTHIHLASAAGVEPGTVLELTDPLNHDQVVGSPVKVVDINRSDFTIRLADALSGVQLTAHTNAVGAGRRLGVRSREFRLIVYLLRQLDPAQPVRSESILDSEVFDYLSMDHRHSRYIQKVIGDIKGPKRLSDNRSEGESRYIRVHDLAQDIPKEPARTTELERVRLGPETLIDVLPDGRTRPARRLLEETVGNDAINTLTDGHYIGLDDPNPELRTGLHSLRNIEEVSIVACPGRTSVQVQNALINHCELMRYRFAVLDGPRPPKDTLFDVQTQRQQFDTKYAALYHPWLLIPDPYAVNPAQIQDYPIPPSGHTVGIYARTDIERGVHKAPANEVVRGIIGLQRILNKEQQDILNPYPVNINVIRDFRDNNRGIRVYGGRCITSDSDWKYVNVRRLLIFIEASLDRGLQWVVFEPNEEPLWARVRRSITNFLNLVWRNGALEGTKPEEAFFVKCDRTTMTQTDLDSGRLICLVGVAPVKPAEFVIVRIGLWTAHADN